jgi:uncharacterized membrane protein YeaQ/YmgE (transglycosylase-associated protein family)
VTGLIPLESNVDAVPVQDGNRWRGCVVFAGVARRVFFSEVGFRSAAESRLPPSESNRGPGGAEFKLVTGLMNIILFLLIGMAAGWLAGQLVKGRGFGVIENLIIGVIGALIGGFVFGALNVNVGGMLGQLIAATVGAIILLYLLKLIRRA